MIDPTTETFWWITGSGLLMSVIALVGSVTLLLPERTLERLLLPLVALAAGSLLGGALFHLLPAAVEAMENSIAVYAWLALGFVTFFALEQFLHWHHCHHATHRHRRPLGHLVLLADGLHNFIGGLAVGGAFLIDIRVGVTAWIAAAAHEVPQELGDFGVLVHSGWGKRRALLFNFASALTFLAGGLLAYQAAHRIDTDVLVPFGAGNFVYIAAADLIPEIKAQPDLRASALHFTAFAAGLLGLLGLRFLELWP